MALLAAFGCGGSGNEASVHSGDTRRQIVAAPDGDPSATSSTVPGADPSTDPSSTTTSSTPPPGSSSVSASGLRTVTYRGVQFDVPADWPVYDLAADPSTCVRFDVHAVYLGHPGADMNCPAGIIGRADAVLVEPTEGKRHRGSGGDTSANDMAAATATSLQVQVSTGSAAASEVAADVPSAGVSVTLTYRDSDTTAQQILQSFRAAS
jgi:hypothetical protein